MSTTITDKQQLQANNDDLEDLIALIDELPDAIKIADMFKFENIAVDTFSFAADTNMDNDVSHTLGAVPSIAIIYIDKTFEAGAANYVDFCITIPQGQINIYTATGGSRTMTTTSNAATRTTTTIKITNTGLSYKANETYTIITMA